MSTFQTILLVVFGFLGLIAVLAFAFPGIIPGQQGSVFGGEVVLWGTMPAPTISQFMNDFNSEHSDLFSVKYVEKAPEDLQKELISALASGKGPDLVVLPHDLIVADADKLVPLPFENFTERQVRDTFIDAAELYLVKEGTLAFPLFVDPLVMYWNRDLFSSAGIAEPPRVWEQFPGLPDKLTIRDDRRNITQSAVALGGVRNIDHSKEILSTLIMQVGDAIVTRDAEGLIAPVLGGSVNSQSQASAAVRFYTEFANPSKTSYSWNSSFPDSKAVFESGTLAVYFGPASNFTDIKKKNPHLNFDVSVMPQRERARSRVVFGRLYGVGVLRNSKKVDTAFRALFALTDEKNGPALGLALGLPSARRATLSQQEKDPILDVFNRSAIIAKGWLDPSPGETDSLFADMVESVIINKNTEQDAVSEARNRLDALFKIR